MCVSAIMTVYVSVSVCVCVRHWLSSGVYLCVFEHCCFYLKPWLYNGRSAEQRMTGCLHTPTEWLHTLGCWWWVFKCVWLRWVCVTMCAAMSVYSPLLLVLLTGNCFLVQTQARNTFMWFQLQCKWWFGLCCGLASPGPGPGPGLVNLCCFRC